MMSCSARNLNRYISTVYLGPARETNPAGRVQEERTGRSCPAEPRPCPRAGMSSQRKGVMLYVSRSMSSADICIL